LKKNRESNVVLYNRSPEIFFRVGVRYASEKNYETALKFLEKAVQKDPFNAEYQLNFAWVLSEVRQIEESNKVLLNIIKTIDPTMAECYFGLACNYFDMGNFKKAKEYFERYIYYDPEGFYTDDAYDILYYLQIYDDVRPDAGRRRTISRLEAEGKKLMEDGDYKKAGLKFEKIIEIDPEVISPRNNLSLAYFLEGEVDKAVSVAKSVLKLDPGNVHANCNLALFYVRSKDLYKKQLEILSKLEIDNKHDFLKALFTCIELKEYGGMTKVLESYLKNNRRARQTLKAVMNDEKTEQRVKTAIKKVLSLKRIKPGKKIKKSLFPDKVISLKSRTNR